jgi:hypothetical protein
MNWRKFVLLGCVVACVFAASTATAQMRRHGNSMSRMGMRGAFTPRSIARMPMHRAPMLGSTLEFRFCFWLRCNSEIYSVARPILEGAIT